MSQKGFLTLSEHSESKGFAPVIIILGIVLLLGVAGGAYFLGKLPIKPTDNSSKACTQEAKICPDGSSVGRTGSNCEFESCSTYKPISQLSSFTEGQEVTVKGTVIENHTKRLTIDGPGWVEIKTGQGIVNVQYHPGDVECKNDLARDTGLRLESGNEVEVFGKYSQNQIETCGSFDYFLKKINQTDGTSNWKTYSNPLMGISFKYPTDKNLQENPGKDNKNILIGMPQSDYILGIFVFDNPNRLSILDWVKADFDSLYGNVEINNKKLVFQDLKMTAKKLIGQDAIEVEFGGQSPDIFFLNPKNLKVYKMMTNFNKDLLNQILSTFKFTQ